jgi:hypothetical protein
MIKAESPVAISPPSTLMPVAPLSGLHSVPLDGLDAVYTAIVRELASRAEISRAEFETLTEQHDLMPDVTIDAINEAALDASDEPLLEGEDPLTINPYALQEMLT